MVAQQPLSTQLTIRGPLLRQGQTPRRIRLEPARVVQFVVAIAVVGVIFVYFLPRIVDYDEVWATIRAMTWLELATLAALAVWNQVTYVLVEMSGRPGLGAGQATKITQTSTAVTNTLPGGAALGAGLQSAMYVSYGFAPPDIAISLTLTGTWNTFAKLGMPIVALALLALGGNAGGGLVAASLIGLAILVAAMMAFAVVLRSERGAFAVGRRLGALVSFIARFVGRGPREDWGTAAADFRRRTIELLRTLSCHRASCRSIRRANIIIIMAERAIPATTTVFPEGSAAPPRPRREVTAVSSIEPSR